MREPEVVDSPTGWVNRHIRRYVESNGEDGHTWRGVPTLLLTTTGRKTGTRRRTALIYGEDDGRYVVVASQGGAKVHPNWYFNLSANPDVEVQVGPEVFPARASTATADDKPRLWKLMSSIWPAYDDYQERTARDIPVVILHPVDA